jgi:hypothetical protein
MSTMVRHVQISTGKIQNRLSNINVLIEFPLSSFKSFAARLIPADHHQQRPAACDKLRMN